MDRLLQYGTAPIWANTDWAQLFNPADFIWRVGYTPLTHPVVVLGALAAYFGIAFGLQEYMRSRPPADVKLFTVAHNAILCLWSAAMFGGVLHAVIGAYNAFYADENVLMLFCDPQHVLASPAVGLHYWTYIYYLSKFYEMIDTFILALKKKDLTFLQMYHHSVVVLLVWSWLDAGWTIHWWGVLANTLVHIWMYYYFAQTALGYKPWWKAVMTGGQLVQFFSVFVAIAGWFVARSSLSCAGEEWAGWFSFLVNLSFLYLFGNFFVKMQPAERKETTKKQK